MNDSPDVSIIIPTYNRCELLQTSVPALLSQITDGFSYEVIFTSNGSTDGTAQYLEGIAKQNPEKFRFFQIEPTGGPSAPRNKGILNARGDLLVILDDDVVPDPDLLITHWRFHQRYPDRHHAALGELRVPQRLLSDPMSLFHTFPYHEVRGLDKLSYVHFWTGNCSVKRQFMIEFGMFDEGLLYFEDIMVGYRLERAGMHLHFLPEANGDHLHKLASSQVAKKGEFTGRWLSDFIDRLPEPEVLHRFGIFSSQVSWTWLFRRAVSRVAFRIVDNPVTAGVLRMLGAENGKRSRWSDAYYYLIFRRNMLKGYYGRERGRKLEQGSSLLPVPEKQ